MKYRYYIEGTEVFPQGEWSISYQRNEGQIFFRRIFDGELTFFDADYDLITGLCCKIATFDIYCGGAIHWQGQFQYPYKATFDDDSCIVVLTPEVVDEYMCIMNNYDTEYHLFLGGIAIDIRDCAGALLLAIAAARNARHWGAPTGSGTTNYLSHLINTRMDCGLTLRSSFMWEDDFANGDNYAGAYGTNNYITGGANRLDQIFIIPNTDLRVALGIAEIGQTQVTTFKDFEEALRNSFNAYWFIDENGHFRIEHISYFDPAFANSDYTVGIDLNTVTDRGGRSYAYRRNKFEYETGRLYDQEQWTWQYYEGTEGTVGHGTDFEGVPVFYGAAVGTKSNYVPGVFKEKDIATPTFWSDIYWAFQLIAAGTESTISAHGWCMLDIDSATNYIRCETGVLSAANQINGHLSTANLQDHYHQYDRIFLSGDMNSGDTTFFQTAQKHKLQDPIEFPLCCDDTFDPLNRIRTGLGDGQVKAAVQKTYSLEVELWHEFDCGDNPCECAPEGIVVWDGVDDKVALSSDPDLTGDKRVAFTIYMEKETGYPGGGWYSVFFDFDGVPDRLIVALAGSYIAFMPSNNSAQTIGIPLSGLSERCINVVVDKTDAAGIGTITSITFNGVAQALVNLNIITSGGGNQIGELGVGNGSLVYAFIWDITIYDISGAPSATHNWIGYPAGNTDAAWIDNVGAIDGTVAGTPIITDSSTC